MPLRAELEAGGQGLLDALKGLLERVGAGEEVGDEEAMAAELAAAKSAGLPQLRQLLDRIKGALGGEGAEEEGLPCQLLHQWRYTLLGLEAQEPGSLAVLWTSTQVHLVAGNARRLCGCITAAAAATARLPGWQASRWWLGYLCG